MAIEDLINKITVRVDVEKDGDWAWNIQYLLQLRRAEYIGIEILGLGALDRDDRTEQRIKKISTVVTKLVNRFQERFTIVKLVSTIEGSPPTYYDLRPCWNKPTKDTKERVQAGTASFEEYMQTKIEGWSASMSTASSSAISDYGSLGQEDGN
jgi:hypothetical protein